MSHSLCRKESFGFENQGHVAFLIVSLCPCHELCTFLGDEYFRSRRHDYWLQSENRVDKFKEQQESSVAGEK